LFAPKCEDGIMCEDRFCLLLVISKREKKNENMINECKDGVKGKKSEVIYVNKLYNRDTNTNTDTEICKISKM